MGVGGKEAAAHRGSAGSAGKAGEARGPANRRCRSPAPEVEDGGVGGEEGRPGLRSSAWRREASRRSRWVCRQGVRWPVAMATASGGLRLLSVVAWEKEQGGEGGPERGGNSERGQGVLQRGGVGWGEP